jgi:hypothetical protein
MAAIDSRAANHCRRILVSSLARRSCEHDGAGRPPVRKGKRIELSNSGVVALEIDSAPAKIAEHGLKATCQRLVGQKGVEYIGTSNADALLVETPECR